VAKSRVGGSTVEKLASGGPTFLLAWPGGLASGDFAICVLSWFEESSSDAITVEPSGFTRIGSSAVFAGASNDESRIEVWYKQLDGSESGNLTIGRAVHDFYGTAVLDVYRGDGALTFASASSLSTPGSGTSVTMPDMAGVSGQLQLGAIAIGDPATAPDTTADMAKGQAGLQNTNTCYTYYKFLTGDIGAQTVSPLGTSRPHIAISVLVDDAGAAVARKIILTRPA
jgi:hypothetical protein